MKRLFIISIFFVGCWIFVSALAFLSRDNGKTSLAKTRLTTAAYTSPANNALLRLSDRSAGILKFCRKNGFNSSHCFMIDMSISAGRERFFIYDLKNNAVLEAGLVTHGSGSITAGQNLTFSNEPGSNATSLGRYKIGKDYMGRFGLAYKLHGLDQSNSNAFKRFVVLHAHSCVPDSEVYPLTICPSLGCPTVSPAFLQKLKTCIDNSAKPILLNIYQ